MILSNDAAIEKLALQFIDRTLPKPAWTHAGHFAAALWLLRHRPELTQDAEIRRLISSYNEATNTPNTDTGGYHHTITLASRRAAAHQLARFPTTAPLAPILHALMASPIGHPDWLLTYWHPTTLFSVPARQNWIEPDLMALPF